MYDVMDYRMKQVLANIMRETDDDGLFADCKACEHTGLQGDQLCPECDGYGLDISEDAGAEDEKPLG